LSVRVTRDSLRATPSPGKAMPQHFPATLAVLVISIVVLTGCGMPTSRHPVPEPLIDSVHVPGLPDDIRMWGDRETETFKRGLAASVRQAEVTYGVEQPVSVLAISGGGSNGAFAAGLLCGWTERGTRPVFRVVSGVSVGAIIAPFAFLGGEYDQRLREMASSATDDKAFRMRLPTAIFSGDSVADNAPLYRFLDRYIDGDLLRAVAAEHAKGRRLYVTTTNLDAGRPVIWDMGAIASSGSPRAMQLFRKIIVASTAAPVFYPPSYIEVEYEGKTYDEMHVDGGVTGQILLYGEALSTEEVVPDAARRHHTYYIICNSKFSSEYEPVQPRIQSIGARAVGRLIQSHAVGDLWQAYATCWRDAMDFRLAAIPSEMSLGTGTVFDARTVSKLFDRGYALARDGYPWATKPPGVHRFNLPPPAAPPDANVEREPDAQEEKAQRSAPPETQGIREGAPETPGPVVPAPGLGQAQGPSRRHRL
jgi:predicted patatin/cPLA2 family phospholipase